MKIIMFAHIDLSGTKRTYSENDPKKINLNDEMIENIIRMLGSPLKDDKKLALGIIRNCNDDIKYLQLMKKISIKFKCRWDNEDKGGSLHVVLSAIDED